MGEHAREAALEVLGRLRSAGYQAYFAGGAVRDLLLGDQPQDYDVATSARPEEVSALFQSTVMVGAHFGVVVVILGKEKVEVATFRTDGEYRDGRHPETVAYSSALEDVRRRDFTVNGLLYDPETGEVLDEVGGEADLRAGQIRCIGDPVARFREDRLRLLRAVRFATRLDFRIETETWSALVQLAPEVIGVSGERIRDELLKMLLGPRPHLAMRLLVESGLCEAILPEVARLAGVEQPPRHHPEGDALEHTLLVIEHLVLQGDSPGWRLEALALAALLHDVGKADTLRRDAAPDGERIRFHGHAQLGARMAEAVAQRLRMSRQQVSLVSTLVLEHDQFLQVPSMGRATFLRFLGRDHFHELLALHAADRRAASGDLSIHDHCLQELACLGEKNLRPARLLDGHEVIAFGVPPGPGVGKALRALEDAQLEGQVATREEAEAWLRRWVKREMEG